MLNQSIGPWLRWQLPHIAYCYAYFPVTLIKRVILKRKRSYIGLDPIVRRFWDKWGSVPPSPPVGTTEERPVWINMNSGGEAMMSATLLQQLDVDHGRFVLSTEAYDSFELLSRRYGRDRVFFPPWDTALPIIRALGRIRPRALVFVQNAYFPVLLALARRRGIKTVLVSGLLSRNIQRGNPILDRATGLGFHRQLDAIAVQTDADAAAFRALGVPAHRIAVTGDLSTDLHGIALAGDEKRRLRTELGLGDQPLFVIGSTHPGERSVVIDALLLLRTRVPAIKFIVAPRQLHEAWFFTADCHRAGLRTTTRAAMLARNEKPFIDHDVLILDTFGELRRLYGIADVAFIGSSLVPLNERGGGHNPLEPLAHGTVPLFGPYMNLWLQAVASLREAWPAIQVDGAASLADRVEDVLAARAPIAAIRRTGVSLIDLSGDAVGETVRFLRRELALGGVSSRRAEASSPLTPDRSLGAKGSAARPNV